MNLIKEGALLLCVICRPSVIFCILFLVQKNSGGITTEHYLGNSIKKVGSPRVFSLGSFSHQRWRRRCYIFSSGPIAIYGLRHIYTLIEREKETRACRLCNIMQFFFHPAPAPALISTGASSSSPFLFVVFIALYAKLLCVLSCATATVLTWANI